MAEHKPRYRQKNTGRTVFILSKENDMLQVRYTYSGHSSWYTRKDFDRLFKKIKDT